uniref:T-cell receptor alpha/delta variable 14.0 n=1 Tax=Scleropages formosus TaxID=113540 RepID=A0A8C9W4H2_SCLFO
MKQLHLTVIYEFKLTSISFPTDYSAGDSITPLSDVVHVLEGNNVTLSCNYSGTVSSIQWYRQYSRSKPEYLLLILESTGKFAKERFSSSADKSSGEASLTISRVQLEDSAVYYCALETTVMNLHQHSYKTRTCFTSRL